MKCPNIVKNNHHNFPEPMVASLNCFFWTDGPKPQNDFDVPWAKLPYYPYHSLALSLYLYSYLLSLQLFISLLSLVLPLTNSTYHAYSYVLTVFIILLKWLYHWQHLPLTSKSPSDTRTSQSWHSTLTSPAKTWQLSACPEEWIYETNAWKKQGSPR